MRPECIEILRGGIDRDEFERSMFWWTIEPIVVQGEIAGAVAMFQNQIHIAVKPEYRGRWAKRGMRDHFLNDRIRQYGPLIAKPFKSNERAVAFIERLGFKRMSEDENQITFQLG